MMIPVALKRHVVALSVSLEFFNETKGMSEDIYFKDINILISQ